MGPLSLLVTQVVFHTGLDSVNSLALPEGSTSSPILLSGFCVFTSVFMKTFMKTQRQRRISYFSLLGMLASATCLVRRQEQREGAALTPLTVAHLACATDAVPWIPDHRSKLSLFSSVFSCLGFWQGVPLQREGLCGLLTYPQTRRA